MPTGPSTAGVRGFFETEARRFDSIYSGPRSLVERGIDLLFHQVIRLRFERTMAILAPIEGKRVIDVGCGPGRYAVELATRGASEVVGIDFAAPMLELARRAAAEVGVDERCRFIAGDFHTVELSGPFDACVAIGFFEYLHDPLAALRRMAELTRGDVVASFPKRYTLRTLPRALRYRLRGCYLRFFARGEIRALAAAAGLEAISVHSVSRDYLLHGRARATPP